ncbi:uncharacterized protein J3R85_010879 [Psidium guajava]|nr:uncharacterized protein J3R85_010879 [Psidium guajava]
MITREIFFSKPRGTATVPPIATCAVDELQPNRLHRASKPSGHWTPHTYAVRNQSGGRPPGGDRPRGAIGAVALSPSIPLGDLTYPIAAAPTAIPGSGLYTCARAGGTSVWRGWPPRGRGEENSNSNSNSNLGCLAAGRLPRRAKWRLPTAPLQP